MNPSRDVRRGSVWGYDFAEGEDPKPCVVVSADRRNASSFAWVHVVRVTSRPKPPLDTIVALGDDGPVHGWAMCDEVEPIRKDDLLDTPWPGVQLPVTAMRAIDAALRAVFDL